MRWLEDRNRELEARLLVPVAVMFVQFKDKNQPVGGTGLQYTVKSKSTVVK